MDGNIGIDGDVGALVQRCQTLLVPGGVVIVEVDPRPAWHQTRKVRLTAQSAGCSAEMTWTRTGAAAVRRLAGPLGLLVVEEWTAGGRSFVCLDAGDHRPRARP